MHQVIAYILFAVIEIVLLPVTVVGYVWLVAKLMLASRRSGASVTAYSPLGARWALHESGARTDEACKQLVEPLSGGSLFLWRMTMGPTFLAMRLTGITPALLQYPAARPSTLLSFVTHRTEFFDKALAEYVDRAQQFVILGAGWDTRAYNLPPESSLRVFEVDQADCTCVLSDPALRSSSRQKRSPPSLFPFLLPFKGQTAP